MIRAAALVSGDGARLQAILDSMYFKEIPDFELVAVISTARDAYAMKRALNAGVPAYVVDPELFPNATSHSMAVANKLKDMDIELVILAGYDMPLGVIPYQSRAISSGRCWNGASSSPAPPPTLPTGTGAWAASSSSAPSRSNPTTHPIPSPAGFWRRASGAFSVRL